MLLIVLTTLAVQGYGKQEGTANNTPAKPNIPRKVIRLDPLLRRALLRALTELEREAIEKAKTEERDVRPEKNSTRSESTKGQQEVKFDEIQSTADTNYPTPSSPAETSIPQDSSTNPDPTPPATIQDAFFFQTPSTIEDDLNNPNQQETKTPDPTNTPPDIESNLISEDVKNDDAVATTGRSEEISTEKSKPLTVPPKLSLINANEVDIFKAPLVAAFTLHQDSKGTPHSVIPLFRKQSNEISQRQKLLEQQLALIKQQQQEFLRQNQFIPSVTITPLSQPHNFPQPLFGGQKIQQSFPSSTAFPPLVSNSIVPQGFSSSVIPSQSFHISSTVAPIRNNFVSTIAPPRNNFVSTISPPRNSFPPPGFSSTFAPQQDFRGVSVFSPSNFHFSPTPQPNFPSPTPTPQQGFQPISIPPVTLPLQNEQQHQSPIVPSIQINPEQSFLQNQEQRLRNQFIIDEQNRQRQIDEQNRQRQIDDQNRQRQIDEQNRQRQIDDQNRQRQIDDQNRQRQLEDQRQRIAEDERQRNQNKDRPQRQEHGVDFQRSLGFTFNQNLKQNFNPVQPQSNNPFNFHIQPSQAFVSSVGFHDVETRNRVNRQEGFGATGNFGFNRQKDQDQRTFGANQFQPSQPFQSFQQPQQYRTIPEEQYRNLQTNRFQPIPEGSRFQPINQQNQFQFRQNQFQNQVQSVNKQLENLLFQSGVATDASGQEDLNIVSKVLALNHERSDSEIDDTRSRSERRVSEGTDKELLVGEIKDSVTTSYTGRA